MEMPAALPDELARYGLAETEEQLKEMLGSNGRQLAHFFEIACADETWCSKFSGFTAWAMSFLTELFFSHQLPLENAIVVANTIQRHILNLEELLPLNVSCEIYQTKVPINSLMFGAMSPYFDHLIYRSCYEKKQKVFYLPRILPQQFKIVQRYIYTGNPELWHSEEHEIKSMIEIAYRFGLLGLTEICQELLMHSIYLENAFPMIHTASENRWPLIVERCCELINQDDPNLQLSLLKTGSLECCLDSISEHVIDNLSRLASLVTVLRCGPAVANSRILTKVLSECSNLTSLDIGRSTQFVEALSELNQKVTELLLMNCQWLGNDELIKIIFLCPWIQRLDLSGCIQISAGGWGDLLKLPQLSSLNLSRMPQLSDAELSIIVEAARGLIELDLEDCSALSATGFHHLVRSGQIEKISLARTEVTDAALVDVLSSLTILTSLNLARCNHLTIEGLRETLRIRESLREVDCSQCNVSELEIDQLRQRYPNVKILSS